MVLLDTASAVTTDESPRMTRTFKMLLPTTLPTEMPALFLRAAVMLTAASGLLVPIATMVSPMMSCGIPNFSAILEAPSTNQSEPFTSIMKPAVMRKS